MKFIYVGTILTTALLVACSGTPNSKSNLDIPLEGVHVVEPSGTSRLIVDRDGTSYAGDLVAVRDHVHKGKGSHFRPRYRAQVSAENETSMICTLEQLSAGSMGRCVNQSDENLALRMR